MRPYKKEYNMYYMHTDEKPKGELKKKIQRRTRRILDRETKKEVEKCHGKRSN